MVLIEDDTLVHPGQEMLLAIEDIAWSWPRDRAESGAEVAVGIAAAAGRPIPTAVMSGSLRRTSGAAAQEHDFTFFAKLVDPQQRRGWLAAAVAGLG